LCAIYYAGLDTCQSVPYTSAMTDADLNFIARQNERLIAEQASQREDMSVLTAIVLRLDSTLTALLTVVRGIHSQIARMNDRIRKLEDSAIPQ
jgi:hypothetical protein